MTRTSVEAASAAYWSDRNTRYTPMGLPPMVLECGRTIHGTGQAVDRYGSLHWRWCCLLAEARYEWYMALPQDMTVRRVPSELVGIGILTEDGTMRYIEVLDGGELGGMPFHPDFSAHLDAPRELLTRKLREYRSYCAGKHATWADHRGQPVCANLLRDTIAGCQPVTVSAARWELTPERATSHLERALRAIWRWRSVAINELDGRPLFHALPA